MQFVLDSRNLAENKRVEPVLLERKHVDEMVKLAALTKPGHFDSRTIEIGNYFGIFEDERLVSMTGQRLRVSGFTEVRAVCSHPHYLGIGYAGILLDHQLELIINSRQSPFFCT